MNEPSTPESPSPPSARWMVGAAKWGIVQRLCTYGFALISISVLARLIPPHSFGVVALGTALIGYVQAVLSVDPRNVLVQRQEITRAHYDTAWLILTAQGALVWLLSIFLAPVAARWMDEPLLAPIMPVVGFALFLSALANPAITRLLRAMDYRTDSLYVLLPAAAQLVVALGVAIFIWPDHRALLAGIVTYAAALFILSYAMDPCWPRMSLKEFRTLFTPSAWISLSEVAIHVARSVDTVLAGYWFNAHAVSQIAAAQRFSSKACPEITAVLYRTLMPGFARLQDNKAEIARQLAIAAGVVALIAAPLSFGVALCAEYLVLLVLGEQWKAAIPLLRIVWLFGLAYGFHILFSSVLNGLGSFRAVALCRVIALLPGVPVAVVATREAGLPGVALGVVFIGLLLAGVSFLALKAHAPFSWGAFFAPAKRIPPALGVMVTGVALIDSAIPSPQGAWQSALGLCATALPGAILYGGTLMLLWRGAGRPDGPERRMLDLARKAHEKWRPRWKWKG